MKIVIVEDNFAQRAELKAELAQHFSHFEIEGEAADEESAILCLEKTKPDIVFMDIELAKNGDGFRVLEKVNLPNMFVVFVSAIKERAVKAFKVPNTIDFLEKPLNVDELKDAIFKIYTERERRLKETLYESLENTIGSSVRPRITLSDQKKIIFPFLDQIIYLKAEANFTNFVMEGNPSTMLVSKNIGSFKKYLVEKYAHIFLEVHRSAIVNIQKIVAFNRTDRILVMQDGTHVLIAQENINDLLKRLE